VHDAKAKALFNTAVKFVVGDGQRIRFWTDPWIDGASLEDAAPTLFMACTMRKLTVREALTNGKWMRHFRRGMTQQALTQFLHVHDKVADTILRPDTPDAVVWKLTSDGQYSTTSAYQFQFEGSIRFTFQDTIWNTDAPLKCKMFSWLAALGRCHTADCLRRKRMPHNAACVMCLGEPETAIHLLANCTAIRRIWAKVLRAARLPSNLAPSEETTQLQEWLYSTTTSLGGSGRHWGSLVQLTWWTIWKERNSRIFQNRTSSISEITGRIFEEARCWSNAAKPKAQELLGRPREPD
jgi:hypothetical protein